MASVVPFTTTNPIVEILTTTTIPPTVAPALSSTTLATAPVETAAPITPSSVTTDNSSTTTSAPPSEDGFCKLILYIEISDSRVRVWDLLLLLPTFLFLLGLLVKINSARLKLRAVHSPIYATFYGLVSIRSCVRWFEILNQVIKQITDFGFL
ncbi:Transmembrane protein adipocyte-associated 1 [Halocaridina rubra]|uniref:Transmembrane protein adipocyte-associated 1 n=1 Tax=Halocaridina rubra TaxID=373956 RepID=A0AAN8WV67_HALRR